MLMMINNLKNLLLILYPEGMQRPLKTAITTFSVNVMLMLHINFVYKLMFWLMIIIILYSHLPPVELQFIDHKMIYFLLINVSRVDWFVIYGYVHVLLSNSSLLKNLLVN